MAIILLPRRKRKRREACAKLELDTQSDVNQYGTSTPSLTSEELKKTAEINRNYVTTGKHLSV